MLSITYPHTKGENYIQLKAKNITYNIQHLYLMIVRENEDTKINKKWGINISRNLGKLTRQKGDNAYR